ncbi:MAG: hypothetical protein RL557_62 [archaeon]|jgi:predicted DNA-binding protein
MLENALQGTNVDAYVSLTNAESFILEMPIDAYENLIAISQETGQTPERILYEMIKEQLEKTGSNQRL